jgi:hypothetical protein
MESVLKEYQLPVGVLVPTVFVPSTVAFRWENQKASEGTSNSGTLPMPTLTLNGSYRPST